MSGLRSLVPDGHRFFESGKKKIRIATAHSASGLHEYHGCNFVIRHSRFVIFRLSVNRAEGISDIEGKVARVAMSDSGKSEFQIRVIRLPRRSPAIAGEGGWSSVPLLIDHKRDITHRTSSSTSRR
jgi:hypothetical protein